MATLSVDYFCTVDGFGYGEGWPGYFGLGGPDMFAWINDQLDRDHTMLMGANTYRAMAEIVTVGDDATFPRMAELPKIVFSKTIQEPLSWANSRVVSDDAVAAVRALKERETNPMRTIGSFSFSRSLLAADLVDRLRLLVFPLVLGRTGRMRILEDLPDLDLELVGSRTLDGRLQLLEYVPTVREAPPPAAT
jgi:dihydrofolate reductase